MLTVVDSQQPDHHNRGATDMTNKLLEQHGAIVTLDFLPVGQGHNTLHLLHKLQGQSADYALQ
jgi:hypothetical protein